MNAVIRKRYPIERLPEDLKGGLPPRGWVDIEIRPGARPSRSPLTDYVGLGPNVHGDEEEVLAHIRSLREDR